MKLIDIINNLDKSKSNQESDITYNLDVFLNDLDLSCYGVMQDRDNPRLKCYWLANHICTDTWVGLRAYFLDDVFVCGSHQAARKSPEYLEWLNKESIHQVRDYILSLAAEEEYDNDPNLIDMNEEMGDGYKIQYTGQCLVTYVLYQGDIVEIVNQDDSNTNFHAITIRNVEGELEDIDIREVLGPWYTEKFN